MKQSWLHKQSLNKLIVFCNGWGMDEHPFRPLHSFGYDVLMLYDYSDLVHGLDIGKIFAEYDEVKSEVKVGEKHRLDLMVSKNGPNSSNAHTCYIEIKNCSLVEDGVACFPDAVTVRGRNHLIELQQLAASGFRAVMFILVNRMDAKIFKPADHIDPAYGKELRKAYQNGVEIMVYDVEYDLKQGRVGLRSQIPFQL